MKTRKLGPILALTLTTGLLLAGCTSTTVNDPAPTTTKSSAAPTQSAAENKADEATVASQYQEFLKDLYSIKAADFQKIIDDHPNVGDSSTDKEKQQVIDSFIALAPTAFKQVDATGLTINQKGQVYGQLAYVGVQASSSNGKIEVTIPATAVTVKNNKASIDISKTVVTVDGKKADLAEGADDVHYVKKNGKWLFTVPTTDSSTATPTPTPSK